MERWDVAFADLYLDALETALAGTPAGHKEDLRLWLRMLSCVNLVEAEIRRRLDGDWFA